MRLIPVVLLLASCATLGPDAPQFQNYPAPEAHRGDVAAPNLEGYERFASYIRAALAEGPNFAGGWTVVTWGCGTSCQFGVVVSAASGDVEPLPDCCTRGVQFRSDSRLLIVNPVSTQVQPFENPYAHYYDWTGSAWVLVDSIRAREP